MKLENYDILHINMYIYLYTPEQLYSLRVTVYCTQGQYCTVTATSFVGALCNSVMSTLQSECFNFFMLVHICWCTQPQIMGQRTKSRKGQSDLEGSVLARGIAGSWESKSSGSSWIVTPLFLQVRETNTHQLAERMCVTNQIKVYQLFLLIFTLRLMYLHHSDTRQALFSSIQECEQYSIIMLETKETHIGKVIRYVFCNGMQHCQALSSLSASV